ncbi:Glycosylphosphatidylinositol anchor attachment 1, partial [Fasciola gigantica]
GVWYETVSPAPFGTVVLLGRLVRNRNPSTVHIIGNRTMKSKIKSKLTKLLSGGSLFPCVIFYIAGLIWFLLLSQDELNNETYLSENALLVGQVVERFDDSETISRFYHEAKELTKKEGDMTKLWDWIADQLDAIGLEVYRQNFTFSHGALLPDSKVEGTNVYGIMRSPSGGRTEALLLTVPPRDLFDPVRTTTAGSLALSLALLKTLRGQIYWAKDIVVVFPEFEYVGLLAWIEAYHGAEKTAHLSWTELEGRSGNIQAGLNLEFATPDIQSVDIFPEGINGLLANLDLVNTVVRLAHKHSIQSVVNGQPTTTRGDLISRRREFIRGSC